MSERRFPRWLLAILFLTVALPSFARDADEVLLAVDAYRLPAESARVSVTVDSFRGDTLDKSRDYRVLISPGRRSLVLMLTPSEVGQKLLMVEDSFWYLLPRSRRPIRITPMQRLLGEASTGDVATMTFSEYYDAVLADETVFDGQEALVLNLTAAHPNSTYARIELVVRKGDHVPLAADLYAESGKMMKQARYHLGELAGYPAIVRMDLIDRIQQDRRTSVITRDIQAADIPDRFYNPMFLVRTNLEDF